MSTHVYMGKEEVWLARVGCHEHTSTTMTKKPQTWQLTKMKLQQTVVCNNTCKTRGNNVEERVVLFQVPFMKALLSYLVV